MKSSGVSRILLESLNGVLRQKTIHGIGGPVQCDPGSLMLIVLIVFPLFSIAEFKRKPGKYPRSEVWNYFTKVGDSEVRCEICSKTYKGGNAALGTSSMKKHLRMVHGQYLTNVQTPYSVNPKV